MPPDSSSLTRRVSSTLPGLKPGESGYNEMLVALEKMFAAYQENGKVVIEHDTWLVYGQLSS